MLKKTSKLSSAGFYSVKNIPIVNKKFGLTPQYNPGINPEALSQFKAFQQDMQLKGLNIGVAYSGFRSYADQTTLYQQYVLQDGQKEADTYSARPGFSEHQTGLAFDLLDKDGNLVRDLKTSAYIQEHCSEYGFIIRYPKGGEAITGYSYEPWHVRYVGVEVAKQVGAKTLEEFLHVDGGNYTL